MGTVASVSARHWFAAVGIVVTLATGVLAWRQLSLPQASIEAAETLSAPSPTAAAETPSPPSPVAAAETPRAPTRTAAETSPGLRLLAHRGMHQTFSHEGVTDETCTAQLIDAPVHSYLENTIASMAAAFERGAAVVELDIAPTADDVLVVFHDWTVDCRTEASGAIRDLTWPETSTLDIGYGYTSDGTTFPFRGLGIGLMPTLEQVLEDFPNGRFLINFKSNDVAEARLLFELVQSAEANHQIWAVYGAHDAVAEYRSLSGTRGFSERTVTDCLIAYARIDLSAAPPTECHDTVVLLPIDLAELVPGGPTMLAQRLATIGTDLILRGPQSSGIDTVQAFNDLPEGLNAFVWTNRIDLIGSGD